MTDGLNFLIVLARKFLLVCLFNLVLSIAYSFMLTSRKKKI